MHSTGVFNQDIPGSNSELGVFRPVGILQFIWFIWWHSPTYLPSGGFWNYFFFAESFVAFINRIYQWMEMLGSYCCLEIWGVSFRSEFSLRGWKMVIDQKWLKLFLPKNFPKIWEGRSVNFFPLAVRSSYRTRWALSTWICPPFILIHISNAIIIFILYFLITHDNYVCI